MSKVSIVTKREFEPIELKVVIESEKELERFVSDLGGTVRGGICTELYRLISPLKD